MARVLNIIFAAFLAVIGAYLAIRGFTLISLGGSWYYTLAGLALLGVAALIIMRNDLAAKLYALITAATIVWSIPEAGLDLLALLPRLAAWMVVGLWFLTPWYKSDMEDKTGSLWVGGASVAALLLLLVSGFQRTDVLPFERTMPTSAANAGDDWVHYGNSTKGTRFSELTQLTPDNVSDLEEVWRYETGISWEFKSTPIEIDGILYTCTPGNYVLAVNAETGAEVFRFNPENTLTGSSAEELARGNTFSRGCRGVSYHKAGSDYAGSCPERILTGTTDARLIALNSKTGERCEDFGSNGEINLREGLGPHPAFGYFHTSVPLIAGDKVVVGGWVVDNQELGNPSGVLRAYSVYDGSFNWAFDIGRPGDPSFPEDGKTFTRGTPNVWSITSYDPDLDLIYAPTGNASPDYYGAKRREIDEEINAAVIAIRGSTGELVWVYRTVYHDIWDYDAPSQPTLVDIRKDGELIPAVVQPTKRGELFLLDRRDGTPIWPATDCPDGSTPTSAGECPVPQSPAKGDWVSPVQPFSGLPRFNDPRTEKDMWGLTPLDQLYCRIEFKKMRYEGHFTPPMPGGGVAGVDETWGGTFQYPGNQGGFNWPNISVDADNGLLVAQPMLMGNRIYLLTAEERAKLRGNTEPPVLPDLTGQGPWEEDAPRYAVTGRFMSQWKIPFTNIATNMPCFEPPYGRLALIDLNSKKLLWSRPIGNMNELGPFGIKPGLPFEIGTPVYGSTVATRSGLIFQTGTLDSMFRAIDTSTGKTLWQTKLPATSNSTPVTYAVNGRQYVVLSVAAAAGREDPVLKSSVMIAYALPETD